MVETEASKAKAQATPQTPTNVIQIYRDPYTATPQWVARIGPGQSIDTHAIGNSPCSAVGYLLRKLAGGVYDFDEQWQPEK